MLNWENIWNKREFDESKKYEYNGYKFKDNDEYDKFIFEITKNITIKNNQKILDIGCGNGSFINKILNNKNIENYDLTGIDFCHKNISYAKNNYIGDFFIHDIKNLLPFNDNSFDVVLCISTLFYLANEKELEQLLNEIKRICKVDGLIFLGNCMDFDKKTLALSLREISHQTKSTHLYIKKTDIVNIFDKSNIIFTDLDELEVAFYTGQKYKFNAIIENIKEINIGIDFHDTLSYDPNFFKILFSNWKGKIFIVTGTPLSKINIIKQHLNNLGFFENIHYHNICCGYEYNKEDMDYTHFEKMKKHKLKIIKDNNIKIYFDDNPFYVDYLKDFDIKVYQSILSKKYIDNFKNIDKYFCCNLQEKQFGFLEKFSKKKRLYIPGVFDLFHIGHLKLLNKFRKDDNFLIIGVQDDISVFKSKNNYPVLNVNERMDFIKELNFVDRVISYNNTDQSKYLKELNIEVFIIGPEFGNSVEHKKTLQYCYENNIEVITTERTKDISTTLIVNKILNK